MFKFRMPVSSHRHCMVETESLKGMSSEELEVRDYIIDLDYCTSLFYRSVLHLETICYQRTLIKVFRSMNK